ncbi:hypothetical protein B9Z51_04655 [Limnohabitans sp. T6-5]|uniref:hypothetical protein n=1 Tax=Limnohabitans sp. T6-5 TaxID=1100724 RepID=UPI000D3C89AD|nr:hypothetical protein [Limnohabitans sp. T6-5]PUE11582.1 hypothetical protein B9Z51_04655 [Limnohabitans sp. T6-5]
MKQSRIAAVVAAALGLGVSMHAAQAQEVYAGAGLFGVQLGYSHALNSSFNVRADYMTMGNIEKTNNQSGTDYKANIDLSRTALLADWFPFQGSFRLTTGVTFNQLKFNLMANTSGQTVDINGSPHTLVAGDSMNVQVKMPSTTPYIGFGFGHQSTQKGWGFHSDIGVIIGSFSVTETRTGQLANVPQADVDKELADVRKSVSKLNVLPQVTLGVSYRF